MDSDRSSPPDQSQPKDYGAVFAKWMVLVLFSIGLVAFILVKYPESTDAAQNAFNYFTDSKGDKRDLSTPLSRLEGYWECISGGANVYYTVDSRRLFGSCEIDKTTETVIPAKFKVLYDEPSGENLITKEFIPLKNNSHISFETYICISKDGQSMTKEWNYNDDESHLFVYRYAGKYRNYLPPGTIQFLD